MHVYPYAYVSTSMCISRSVITPEPPNLRGMGQTGVAWPAQAPVLVQSTSCYC